MQNIVLAPLPPDEPANVVGFAARVGFLSVTFTWTPPFFLGVPASQDPADFIVYILDVMNGTDSVGGAIVPHPTTTVVVNLTYPCEEYTATIFARNRQAGNGPPTMEMFTLNETSVWQPNEIQIICCTGLFYFISTCYNWDCFGYTCVFFPQVPSMSVSLQRRTLSPTSSEQPVPTTPSC